MGPAVRQRHKLELLKVHTHIHAQHVLLHAACTLPQISPPVNSPRRRTCTSCSSQPRTQPPEKQGPAHVIRNGWRIAQTNCWCLKLMTSCKVCLHTVARLCCNPELSSCPQLPLTIPWPAQHMVGKRLACTPAAQPTVGEAASLRAK